MGRNFNRDEILIDFIGVKPICFLFNWDAQNDLSVYTYLLSVFCVCVSLCVSACPVECEAYSSGVAYSNPFNDLNELNHQNDLNVQSNRVRKIL